MALNINAIDSSADGTPGGIDEPLTVIYRPSWPTDAPELRVAETLSLPYNLGANDFNSTQFFSANGTLSEQPWIVRKHQSFRMVSDATAFYGSVPTESTNSRLIARSVWNSQWKIVIPANTLMSNEQDGLNRFAASVKDIQLFLRTYSNSGN